MSKEEILEKAKRDYPRNSRFISSYPGLRENGEYTVTCEPYFYSGNNVAGCPSEGVLYYNGIWATPVVCPILETTDYQIF